MAASEKASERRATGERPSPLVVAVGAAIAASGLWALASPSSFFDSVATYPPYNPHFIRDIGAFMTGLGASLILLWWSRDALGVVLGANAVAAVLHAISHIVDADHGRTSDPYVMSLVAVLFVWAAVRRLGRTAAR